jgi:hypothetical protein
MAQFKDIVNAAAAEQMNLSPAQRCRWWRLATP